MPIPLPLKHAPRPTVAAITAQDLMTRLYIFADDSMQGREAGTIGNVKGTEYIASEIRKMGLIPAGDSGTYFQILPFKTRSVDPASTLTVSGAPLTFGTDWVMSGGKPVTLAEAPVIFGGVAGDTSKMIAPGVAAGKIVVLLFRPPALIPPERVKDAAALILVGIDQFMPFIARPATYVDDPTNPPAARQGGAIILSTGAASKLFDAPLAQLTAGTAGRPLAASIMVRNEPVAFPARNVVGIVPGSDPALKGQYVAIGAHNDHVGLQPVAVDHDSVRFFTHIVRPQGAEQSGKQATPDEQAWVNRELARWRAAHPNSSRPDSIANGADDDGSGSVSVLEIAQKIAASKTRPKRSMLFVWHVGEEKGLLGSAWFTDHPTVPRDSIVAQLNIDMIGRGDAWDVTGETKDGTVIHGSPNYVQLIGSRRLSTEMGNLVETVNTQGHHGLQFDYSLDANGHPANIYCRSDHYEYARYGIPITFFTTGGHSDYHQVTDEPQYIDYHHMARVAELVGDVAVHIGNLDHRLVVDQPKPDPKGACRQ